MNDQQVVAQVRRNYAAVANTGLSTKNSGVRRVAEAFSYTAEELASAPAEAAARAEFVRRRLVLFDRSAYSRHR